MLRKLRGKSVIQLYSLYESDEYVHLVMEFIDGDNLFTYIKSKRNYTEGDVKRIMKALMSIVDSLHQIQVIHRDLSPENIYVSYLFI